MNITLTINPDFSALTTFALCDEATEKVTFRRKTHAVREANLDLADDRAGLSRESATEALARKDGEIAGKQAELTAVGLSAAKRELLTEELALLQAQRPAMVRRISALDGLDRFLDSLAFIQADVLEAVLTAVLGGIATHRATLSA